MLRHKLRISRVQKIGNSKGITIPVEFLRALGITAGDYVRMDLDKQVIMLRSVNEKPIPHRAAARETGPGDFLGRG